MSDRYRLYGVLGSPYAAKMRALLRYRHIPFNWIPAGLDWAPDFVDVPPELRNVRPAVIPILWFPSDGSYRNDSTVLAYELEKRHPNGRSVIPDDPGHAFLSHLLEDMGDEWGMKMAFWYRWSSAFDKDFRSRMIMAEIMGGGVAEDRLNAAARQFRDRQVERMKLVGSTPENGALIEKTFLRTLDITSRMHDTSSYLFGSRPALADFGSFGALYTCWNDPASGRIMMETAPRTLYWLHRLDEASGVEGKWVDPEAPLPDAVVELLQLAGEVYLPFLVANAAAIKAGKDRFSFTALGLDYAQGTFRYQAKCLQWLREEFKALGGKARKRTERVLEQTGCLQHLLA